MNIEEIEQIAAALEENYEEEDIPEGNLEEVKEMVLSLNEFDFHEDEITQEVLEQVLEHWLEIRG